MEQEGGGTLYTVSVHKEQGSVVAADLWTEIMGQGAIKLQFPTNLHLHCREYKIGLVSNYMYLLG